MSSSLDGLPYDILFGVSLYLDIEDIISLHNACRRLRFLLGEETLCRRLLENCAGSTLEAKGASKSGYGAAIRRIYKRRHAVATGQPASVAALGYALDVIYNEGVACILEQTDVHILDLHGTKGSERASITSLLGQQAVAGKVYDCDGIQLLSYRSDILAFSYEDEGGESWLLAVNIAHPLRPEEVMKPERLRSTHKLFVEQTKDFLFYGTRTATGNWCGQRYREWLIQGVALNGSSFSIDTPAGITEYRERSDPIQLHSFAGSEIGTTAAFRIHEGYFYAITNCDAFDVIEVDFTSVYHCIRFPVENPQRDTCHSARFYRRQHIEGPVNDGWNSLQIQVDERTNKLLVVEGRGEWPCGVGDLRRGFYTHELDFENGVELAKGPAGDAFSSIPDEETKYCSTPMLPPWHAHLETNNINQTPAGACPPTPALSRSRYRAYNFTSMASLELFEQPCRCRGVDGYCLQLRSSSRKPLPATPVSNNGSSTLKGKQKALSGHDFSQLEGTGSYDYQYQYSTVSLWPGEDSGCHELMNLPVRMQGSAAVDIKAWTDERSIVYFIHVNGIGKVVCLNFDGDAPVTFYKEKLQQLPPSSRARGHSPRQQSDPEHVRQISPVRPAYDHPVFDPHEAKPDSFVSTWDLESIPDAEQLGMKELEEWFDLWGDQGKSSVAYS